MNIHELRERFPDASADFLRLNSTVDDSHVRPAGPGKAAKLERDPGDGTVGEVQIQKGSGRRFLVRLKSYRRRLLDEDNLCEKYLVDLCRYSGALPSDAPGTAKIEVTQEKVDSSQTEQTLIEIFELQT